MTAGGSGEGGEATTGAGRRRKLIVTAVKIVLGLGILGVIFSQLRIDDVVRYHAPDGTVLEAYGRELSVSGVWRITDTEGRSLTVDVTDYPILEEGPSGRRVRLPDGTILAVRDVRLEGTAALKTDAGVLRIPLERVAFDDGARKDGLVEKLPSIKEGLATIFSRLSLGRYLLALGCIFMMYLCGVLRWRVLLRAQGLSVRFWRAFQLTFIGFFFNNVVPGLTGGDLVKAVMIARDHKGKGPAAVSTVIADRVIGILVLALMSAVVLLFTFSRYREAALAIFLFLGGVALAVVLFFSRRVRRRLRLNEVLKKLPGSGTLQRLDEAFLLYRDRKVELARAVGLSVVSHAFNIFSIYVMGTDLGVDRSAGLEGQPLVTYLATVPIILIASSVPLLPGGWGLGELMFGYFFRTVGVRNLGLSVGLSVLSRASMLLWSLLGGVFLVFHREEAREALHETEDVAPAGAP